MTTSLAERIAAMKRRTRIEEVLAQYGVALHHQQNGHLDAHPSFAVYRDTQTCFCFVCRMGGDVIDVVQLLKGCSFMEALACLDGQASPPGPLLSSNQQARPRRAFPPPSWEDVLALVQTRPPSQALTLASVVYHTHLLQAPALLHELASGGITLGMVRNCLLGYVDAHTPAFLSYIQSQADLWREALDVGLVTHHGGEFLQGRIVFPEIRDNACPWMIGRVSESMPGTALAQEPKYLGLSGSKPLLGYGKALLALQAAPATYQALLIEEGARDWVLSVGWRLPVIPVALPGTYASSMQMAQIRHLHRLSGGIPLGLCLDWDKAGAEGTASLLEHLADLSPFVVPQVATANDIGDLGKQPNGRALFLQTLTQALERVLPC